MLEFNEVDSGAMVCVIIAFGMSVAFLVADHKSITTRMLAVFLVSIALSIFFNVVFVRPFDPAALPWASKLAPVFTGLSLFFGAEWILRIRRMVPAGNLRTRFGDAQFRLAQLFAVSYIVVGIYWNELRAEHFVGAFRDWAVLGSKEFWYFGAPFLLAVGCIIDGTLITLRRKPDHAEAVRLVGIAIAAPLIASGLLLPSPLASYLSAIGQMIFLISAVQYHVLQGQRGQFLKRFLSPSVAEMVRRQGLDAAMTKQKLSIAVVACDLRGYTSYAQSRDSEDVIGVLQDFYTQVGLAAAEFEATIKDYAGDGVLLLLGAPVPVADHAARAVALAASIRARCRASFAARGVDLGVGIGVSTGLVSVGIIGKERLEYVAVGQAINLAARLCQSAVGGEVLVDESTLAEVADHSQFLSAPALELKGFTGHINTWQLRAA